MQAAAGGSLAKEFLKLCDVVPPMSYSDCFHKLVCDCLSPSLSVSALSSTLMDPFVSPPIKIALVYLSLSTISVSTLFFRWNVLGIVQGEIVIAVSKYVAM